MGTSPDRIRADIEATRNKLAGDLDRLADRASPRRMAQRRGARVRDTASGLRERIAGSASGSIGGARERGSRAARSTRDTAAQAGGGAGRAPQEAARRTRGNPLAAGAVAFGAGLMAASLAPASRQEQQAAERLSERAGPVRDAAFESARHVRADGGDTVRQAAQSLKDSAAGTVRNR
ncbi:DUF3618 domain-containing protein [Streptomyces sp. MP131-18]|uniref:DUF3618 domain-containing protein n=1 Tax=Streptomyces sp. MP131-18 TaxID=1857892 RepID=UPI00097BAED4|nr:DUF3618 domain-containing protein [Streptomyces sp. MP131-18]ONK09928.1 hypothetical protein STBA_06320 [Streptomyces sp. MP131-18]